jgi:hypothetical protein
MWLNCTATEETTAIAVIKDTPVITAGTTGAGAAGSAMIGGITIMTEEISAPVS